MSLLSSGVGMKDRCTILRDLSGPDSWGQPEGIFTTVATDVPCLVVPESSSKQSVKSDRVVEVLMYDIAVMLGTDVQKGDRIECPDRFAGSVTVVVGQAYRDHIELVTEATQ